MRNRDRSLNALLSQFLRCILFVVSVWWQPVPCTKHGMFPYSLQTNLGNMGQQFVYISQPRVFTNCTTKALCTYHTWAIWFLVWQMSVIFLSIAFVFVGFIVRLVNFNICCLEPDEPFFFLVASIGWVWFYWQLKRANCCRANDLKTKVEQVYGASRNACLKRSSLAKESCNNGVT